MISIIVPVYNTERYIGSALESLIAQTYRDIEILVIDDGSTDRSGAIIDALASTDARIKVFHEPNKGQAASRNLGLANANGEYVMFCDSDDRFRPEMCERMRSVLEKNDADWVCCHNDWLEEAGVPPELADTRRVAEAYFNTAVRGLLEITDDELSKTNVLLWNKIFRRDLISRYGIRFPDGHEADDDAFCFQYGLVSKNIFHLPERLYEYRIRSGSVMASYLQKKPRNRDDYFFSAVWVIRFAEENRLLNEHVAFLRDMISRNYRTDKEFFELCERPEHLKKYNELLKRLPSPTFKMIDTGKKQFMIPVPKGV